MKKNIALMAILALTFIPAGISGQELNEHYVEVKGTAEKTVKPDKITFSITINENDYRNSSLSTLEKAMKKSLSDLGIDIHKSLKVSDMSGIIAKVKSKKPDAKLSRDYQLVVNDAAIAASVPYALEEVGISKVYISKFEYSAIDSLKMIVRAEAVRNAKESATVITQAIGQKLGPAIYISEQDNGYDTFRPRLMYAKAANADSSEEDMMPELEFQDIKVSCRLIVRFRL